MDRFLLITALHVLGGCFKTWFVMRPEDCLPALVLNETSSTLFALVVSSLSLQLVTVPVSLSSTFVFCE